MTGLWYKKPAGWNSNRIPFPKRNVADFDLHEENQTCSYGEKPFRWSRRYIFHNNFPEDLDSQNFEAWIKINGFLIESYSAGVRFSIEILVDELKPGVAEKKSVWIMTYISIDGTYQNFGTMGIVRQDEKPPIFWSSTLLQGVRCWLSLKRKNWALYSWRELNCNIEES